jgi:hypothetical protein
MAGVGCTRSDARTEAPRVLVCSELLVAQMRELSEYVTVPASTPPARTTVLSLGSVRTFSAPVPPLPALAGPCLCGMHIRPAIPRGCRVGFSSVGDELTVQHAIPALMPMSGVFGYVRVSEVCLTESPVCVPAPLSHCPTTWSHQHPHGHRAAPPCACLFGSCTTLLVVPLGSGATPESVSECISAP